MAERDSSNGSAQVQGAAARSQAAAATARSRPTSAAVSRRLLERQMGPLPGPTAAASSPEAPPPPTPSAPQTQQRQQQAHQQDQRYKAVLCRHYTRKGHCPFGSRCHFAHGPEERQRYAALALQQAARQHGTGPQVRRGISSGPEARPGAAYERHSSSSGLGSSGAHAPRPQVPPLPPPGASDAEFAAFLAGMEGSGQGALQAPSQAPPDAGDDEELAAFLAEMERSVRGRGGGSTGGVSGTGGSSIPSRQSAAAEAAGALNRRAAAHAGLAQSAPLPVPSAASGSAQHAQSAQRQGSSEHTQHTQQRGSGAAMSCSTTYAAAGPGRGGGGKGGGGSAGGSSSNANSGKGSGGEPLDAELLGVLHRRFHSLLCPITLEPFSDPVVAADGMVYERSSIEAWIYKEGHDTSPLTNEALPHKLLMPCPVMRRCVEEAVAMLRAVRQQIL